MGSRPVAAGLVASLLALTGCALPASEARQGGPTTASTASTMTSSVSTSTTVTVPVSTTTTAAAPSSSSLAWTLGVTWSKTPTSSCLMVTDGPAVLFERNPDQPVIPASTMKLLSATAVLNRIDPMTRLSTPVRVTARPDANGLVSGDIWLVGGGDPVLATSAYRNHGARGPQLVTSMEALADRIVAAGVRHVFGRVVGDDSRYERVRYLPSWPTKYVRGNETGPLSALSVNDGFQHWNPDVPFGDPAAGAAGMLNELLLQRGVVVDGPPASGSVPPGAVELTAMPSPTIAELVGEMLLSSDNDTAELLLRELGLRVLGQGTTNAGLRVAIDTLAGLGLPTRGVHMVDGSGLDPTNRVTCRLVTAILNGSPSRAIVAQGIPVAAQSGTLYKRFLGTAVAGRLRAKTGSIKYVAALAGYADGANGRPLTFAYLQNGVGPKQGQQLQDELGRDLVLATP